MKKIITKLRKGIPVYLLIFAALLFTVNSFGQTPTSGVFTSVAGGSLTDPVTWGNPPTGDYPGEDASVTINHDVYYLAGSILLDEIILDDLIVDEGGNLNAPDLSISLNDKAVFIVGEDAGGLPSLVTLNDLTINGHPINDLMIFSTGTLTLEGDFWMGPNPTQFQLDGTVEVKGTLTIDAGGGDVTFGLDGGGTLIAACFAGDGYIFGHKPASDLGCDHDPINAYTWVGRYSSDWRVPGNWDYYLEESTTIPNGLYDVNIPKVISPPNYYPDFTPGDDQSGVGSCKNLTIAPGAIMEVHGEMYIWGNLFLEADATGAASFLAIGYANVTGTTTAQVYIPQRGNDWAVISPPLLTEIGDFIEDNGFGTSGRWGGTVETYDIGIMDEGLSGWDFNLGSNLTYKMRPGVGYMINTLGMLDRIFEFEGTLPVLSGEYSDVVTPVVKSPSAYGFNGFGNPYTASLDMDAYLTANTGWQTGTPTAWYYNGSTYVEFDVYGTDPFALPGQGILTQASINATNVTLNEETMQDHAILPTTIKSGKLDHYRFKLNASLDGSVQTTKINFRYDRTVGLDPIADAKLFNSNSPFALYTKVDGYPEVDFGIQALPDYNLNGVSLPVGLNCKAGGEVTFSASDMNLPDGILAMFLEDKQTGRFTDLTNGTYTAEVEVGTKGEGRFYIHFKSLTTGIDIDEAQALKAFYNGNQEIQIEGQVGAKSTASVFDMSGKLLGNYHLKAENHNVVPVSNLENGVYILRVIDGQKVYKTRISVL